MVGTPEWIKEHPTEYLHGMISYSSLRNKGGVDCAIQYLKDNALLSSVHFDLIARFCGANDVFHAPNGEA